MKKAHFAILNELAKLYNHNFNKGDLKECRYILKDIESVISTGNIDFEQHKINIKPIEWVK